MASRTTNIVLDLFNVLGHLSCLQNGATIGEIEKAINWMTRGQVQNSLKILSEMGFTYHEVKPHGRTGKRVFYMTETAAIQLSAIARDYTERH